jgi:hypothetical protein
MVNTPGMLRAWRHMAKTGDRAMAFVQMSHGFPQLPGLMVLDIIDNRLPGTVKDDTISFEWFEPLGTPEDYMRL